MDWPKSFLRGRSAPVSSSLSLISQAKRMLESATTFEEILKVENVAARARDYAKAAGAGREAANAATKVMLDARRRAGQELRSMKDRGELEHGGDRKSNSQAASLISLADLGLTYSQSSRYQQEASVPDDVYEGWAQSTFDSDHETFLTATGLRKLAARQSTPAETCEPADDGEPINGEPVANVVRTLAELDGKRFACIYADPPWQYGNQRTRAATDNHYSTMTVDQLAEMAVGDVAADDAHLHIWTTSGFLFDTQRLMEAWGFKYKSSFVWVKPQMGIGNYWRIAHEFLLLGVRGDAKRFEDHSMMSWLQADRTKHSAKPEQVRRMIERASKGPYLELFGRTPIAGWTVLGNQVEARLFT